MAVDPRVRYVVRERNLGVNGNIGTALCEVQTPFCSILPDDDVMLPEFYEVTLRGMREYPEVAFSAGRSLLMTEAGKPVSVMPGFRTPSGYYTAPHGILPIISGHMVSHLALNGILFRTEIARRHWLSDAPHGSPSDIEFILRLSSLFPYVLCDEVVLLIRLHGANLGKARIDLYHGWLSVYRKLSSEEWLQEPYRSVVQRKFFLQLRNAYAKIWYRCVAQENWSEAYVLAEILGEEFGLGKWGRALFQATQFFRKNPGSARWKRLCLTLRRKDEKYLKKFFEPFVKYSAYLNAP